VPKGVRGVEEVVAAIGAVRSGRPTAPGVVEVLVAGVRFASPVRRWTDISPDGGATVLSTYEQLLGGENGQVYVGCWFPADPAYAGELARHGRAVGEQLARRGVIGRLSVDFAAGLQFDHRTGTGVVLHMLSGLAIDGRFGLTAIGRTPGQAAELYQATKSVVPL
jgi:hypothetical protein